MFDVVLGDLFVTNERPGDLNLIQFQILKENVASVHDNSMTPRITIITSAERIDNIKTWTENHPKLWFLHCRINFFHSSGHLS